MVLNTKRGRKLKQIYNPHLSKTIREMGIFVSSKFPAMPFKRSLDEHVMGNW